MSTKNKQKSKAHKVAYYCKLIEDNIERADNDDLKYRDKLKHIKKHLCCFFLSRQNDINKYYRCIKEYENCKDIFSFYAKVFETDIRVIKVICNALNEYTNIFCENLNTCKETPIKFEPEILALL